MNHRDRIISDNISYLLLRKDRLTDWEQSFVDSVNGQARDLSQKQFNRLQEITQNVKRKELIG